MSLRPSQSMPNMRGLPLVMSPLTLASQSSMYMIWQPPPARDSAMMGRSGVSTPCTPAAWYSPPFLPLSPSSSAATMTAAPPAQTPPLSMSDGAKLSPALSASSPKSAETKIMVGAGPCFTHDGITYTSRVKQPEHHQPAHGVPEFQLDFVVDLDKAKELKYVCVACNNLTRPAMATSCGHVFCRTCLDHAIFCPNPECLRVLDTNKQHKPVLCFDLAISKLAVKCGLEGCSWCGAFVEWSSHRLHTCPRMLVACCWCKAAMPREMIRAHEHGTCPRRPYTCSKCSLEVTHETVADHARQCLFMTVACSLGCGFRLERRRLNFHCTNECHLRPMRCELHAYGCMFVGNPNELCVHMQYATADHLRLTLAALHMKSQACDASPKVAETAAAATSDDSKMSLDTLVVAVNSQEWCGGLYHKLDCVLAGEERQCAKLPLVLIEQCNGDSRKPCLHCKPLGPLTQFVATA